MNNQQDSIACPRQSIAARLAARLAALGLATTNGPSIAGWVTVTAPDGEALQIRVPSGVEPGPFECQILNMMSEISSIDEQASVIREFGYKLMQSYEEVNALFRIIRFMGSAEDPGSQMQLLCNIAHQVMPFGWIAVLFRNSPTVTARLRGCMITSGSQVLGASLTDAAHDLLHHSDKDNWTRVLEPQRHTLAAIAGCEVVHETIAHDGEAIGILLAGAKSSENGEIASPELLFLSGLADFIGTFHENACRFEEQRAMSLGTLEALTTAIDAKDPYTHGHSERVAMLSAAIAAAMGMPAAQVERVRIAGLVHDVGKIGVPEAVLCKCGKLTDEEFALIKRHPEIGRRILSGVPLLSDVLPGVLYHHERVDGRGYPEGLSGDQIPLLARIIGVADAFDAMSSTRSYRSAMPRATVLGELTKGAGKQFSPEVLEAFMKVDLSRYDQSLEYRLRAAA